MSITPLEPADALDDAKLAVAAARGNQLAFTAIYDRYADRLYDFCAGMLRDRDAAADCVQDVFVTAATKLTQLEDPDRLRAWLYAIARHQALERIRFRRREMPSDELPEQASADADPATVVARHELADLIDEACGGLSDRDRAVYELAYRHGLAGPELAKALGVSHTNANTLVGRLRDGIERSLGALLVCRGVKADPAACPELALLVANWDGTFTVLMRKRAVRHIEGCVGCDSERRRRVNPVTLLGSAPVFLPAPAWLRGDTLRDATAALPAAGTRPERESSYLRAALGASLLLLGIGGVVAVSDPLEERVEPASAEVEPSRSRQAVTIASTPSSSATEAGTVSAASVSTTPPEPVLSPTSEPITPTLTSAPMPTSTSRTTAINSFEPSRPSTTRTRTPTSTAARTNTGTMTATYLPGTPQPPVTSPSSEPIE
jgi:RNA polymerase sigma factor (sigma-70 family)